MLPTPNRVIIKDSFTIETSSCTSSEGSAEKVKVVLTLVSLNFLLPNTEFYPRTFHASFYGSRRIAIQTQGGSLNFADLKGGLVGENQRGAVGIPLHGVLCLVTFLSTDRPEP